MPINEQLLYQSDKSSHQTCSIKKEEVFSSFPVNITKFLTIPVLENICVQIIIIELKKDFLEKPPVTI